MSNIQITNLTKKYGSANSEVIALNDISLELNYGELVVVLGPSGSGKSTFLNILGGMDTQTSGTITIDDFVLTKATNKQLVYYRRNIIGFVFQFYNLMRNLTVKENIQIAASVNNADLQQVIHEVGLTTRNNHFPNQLSGGEQQRVSIARAIVKKPKLLLCDEPTGALDSKTGRKIIDLLIELAKDKNRVVIIVTHNSEIARVADRIITLSDGSIVSNIVNPQKITTEDLKW
jgi:putative ABC transport system ATP-binding protein